MFANNETGGGEVTEDQVRKLLQKAIKEAGGVRALARDYGISASAISESARGIRPMSDRLLNEMFLYRKYVYFRVGKNS